MEESPLPDSPARLLAVIDQLVAELRPGAPVAALLDSHLERDLGLDSLARVELLARLESAYGVRLGDVVLGGAETARDLLAAIASGAPRAADGAAMAAWVAPAHIETATPERAVSLVEVLRWHVERHPQRPHVMFLHGTDQVATLAYGELLAVAGEVAAGLRRLGVQPGECVALMLPTGLEFFYSFYGILLLGAIPVPIYPPTRPGQIEDHLRRQAGILQNCEAVALISFDAAKLLAHILGGLLPGLRQVTTVAELRQGGDAMAAPVVSARAGDIALLQYTSGSTGQPKGVTLDHGNLLANIRAWGQAIELDAQDVVVSWLPLYHDMGLIGAWLGSLYHACPLVLMSPLDFLARPERWLWAIHHYRGTVTAAPNFAYELCLRHLDPLRLKGLDLGSWRYAANGAEPVAAETLMRFAAAFAAYGLRAETLAPVYGLAECSVGLAVSPPGRGYRIDRVQREALLGSGLALPTSADDDQALQLVACGRPLPGHEVRLVDGQGNVLPPRQVGHLQFRGPSATRGYYRNEAASRQLIRDGWLDSGDLAYFADGDIFITGRLKDTIIRGGRNLYPYELEEAVGAMPGVRRGCVAVFGVAAAGQGTEKLVVVAETRETAASLREDLVRRIQAVAIDLLGTPPDEVVLAPPHAVRKTSSGKIRRAATRDAYCAGTLAMRAGAPWRQLLRLGLLGLGDGVRKLPAQGLAWLFSTYAWCVFGVFVAFALPGILVLPRRQHRWAWLAVLARLCLRTAGVRVHVSGGEHLPHDHGVLVANHASYIDALVLVAALPRPPCFIAKQELAGVPLLGGLLRRLGVEFVERFDARQGVDDVRRLTQIGAEQPLCFFAEGTFTRQAGLRAFRLGAFQVAVQNALAVTPLALAGTRQVLRDGAWLLRPGTVSIHIGEPIVATGTGWAAALALRDAARAEILRHCGEADLEATAILPAES